MRDGGRCVWPSFDIGDGWADYLEMVAMKADPLPLTCIQVKQKLRVLNIYFSEDRELTKEEKGKLKELNSFLRKMEIFSLDTCERCGKKPIKDKGPGFGISLCDYCKKALK